MITDEKIRDEFEEWKELDDYTVQEQNFMESFSSITDRFNAPIYYAGFRAAERLAKIEVLEKLIDEVGFDIGGVAYHNIQTQIASLKAEH